MTDVVPTVPERSGNTKQISPAKHWCFTWNNPPENGYDTLIDKLSSTKYIFQKEIGDEKGTIHFQGFVSFDVKVRPVTHIGIKEIHWEKTRGSVASNIRYCSKPVGRLDGPWYLGYKPPRLRRPLSFDWRNWQLDLMANARREPDDRTIFWYWSEEGGVGKSVMTEWLVRNFACVVCAGKSSDMKYVIAEYYEENNEYPDIVVFDVPRSSVGYISYSGIEEIKNGIFCATKYKSKMVIMPHPHVFVFANEEPDEYMLSTDRLKVFEIKN